MPNSTTLLFEIGGSNVAPRLHTMLAQPGEMTIEAERARRLLEDAKSK